jgi:hypothetical protein
LLPLLSKLTMALSLSAASQAALSSSCGCRSHVWRRHRTPDPART